MITKQQILTIVRETIDQNIIIDQKVSDIEVKGSSISMTIDKSIKFRKTRKEMVKQIRDKFKQLEE